MLQPLNEEKSQLSLAEVYEQEYIKQTQVSGNVWRRLRSVCPDVGRERRGGEPKA